MSSIRLIKCLIGFLVCLLILQNGQAGEVANLYETNVLVNNEEEKANRKLLLNKALIKVLVKVTGSREFLKLADANKIINQSESLVQKFSFHSEVESTNSTAEQSTATTTEKTPSAEQPAIAEKTLSAEQATTAEKTTTNEQTAATEEGTNLSNQELQEDPNTYKKTWFWVRFSKRLTDQLLKQYKLPIWGNLRPETLVWLSIEQDRKRYIVSPSNNPALIKLFNKKAESRGISLLFPFGDLQDQNKLSISDLWGNYSQAIQAASIRYHPQAVMATRIYQEPSGLWIAKWSLSVLDKSENWQNTHEDVSVLLTQGVDSLADRLVALFATRADSADDKQSIIQVNNVTDFNGLTRVANYLKRVPAIKTANLIQVKGDSLSYRIHYFGDEQHLIQSLVLGEVLQKVESSRDSTAENEQSNNSEYVPVYLDQYEQNKTALVQPELGKKQSVIADLKEANPANDNLNNKIQENNQTTNTEISEVTNVDSNKTENKLPSIRPDVEFWLSR